MEHSDALGDVSLIVDLMTLWSLDSYRGSGLSGMRESVTSTGRCPLLVTSSINWELELRTIVWIAGRLRTIKRL